MVIPVYNEEQAIGDDLDLIIKTMEASGCEYEIIVVDDGSADRTAGIVRQSEGVILFQRPENQGTGAARTTGLKHARGEFIVIPDGDGTYPNQDIAPLLSYLDEYGMVVGTRKREAGTWNWLRAPAKLLIHLLASYGGSEEPETAAKEAEEVTPEETSIVDEGGRCDGVPNLTAERVIPTVPEHSVSLQEHIARYMFAGQFVEGHVVLDAGCGTGYGAAYLASRGARRVFGVDIAAQAIEYSRIHYHRDNVIFSVMDCTSLDFPDETFDVVVSLEVIEHLGDSQRYLPEMRRVLKRDGVFILSTPNKAVDSPNSIKPLNPFHFKEYTVAELEETLSAHFPAVVLFGQRNVGAISIWRLPSELVSHGEVAGQVPCEAIRAIPCGSSTWTHVKDWKSIDSTIGTTQIDPSYILGVCAARNSPRLRGQDHAYLFRPSSPLEDLLRERERWIKWLETGIEYRDGRIESLDEKIKGLEEALQRIHRSRPYRLYQVAKRLLRIN